MVNSMHTQANCERIITREQTGAAPETPLSEQIKFLDREIAKNESWIEYYKLSKRVRLSKEQRTVHIAAFSKTVENLTVKREEAKALYLASLMPDIGGAMEFAKAVQS